MIRCHWVFTSNRPAQEYSSLSRAINEPLRRKEYRQALQWLAENRQKYAGQWIALRGAQLLAAGLKAAEVFGRVRGQRPPALVMKVELQDLPFAGW
jgi:hypothetical protein